MAGWMGGAWGDLMGGLYTILTVNTVTYAMASLEPTCWFVIISISLASSE